MAEAVVGEEERASRASEFGVECVGVRHRQEMGVAALAWGVVSSWRQWWALAKGYVARVKHGSSSSLRVFNDFVKCAIRTSAFAEGWVGG